MPENALLSHDLFEGLHARVALVSDIELVDEYPSSVLTHARRQHRWIRGDWQILFWLFPFVPSRRGLTRNTCRSSRAGRFSTTCAEASSRRTAGLLVAGWTVLPGARVWAWTSAVLMVLASQLLPLVGRLYGPRPIAVVPVFLRNLRAMTRSRRCQVILSVTFLAVSRVRHLARHRADAGPPDRHQAAASRVGNGGDHRGSDTSRLSGPQALLVSRRDDREPDRPLPRLPSVLIAHRGRLAGGGAVPVAVAVAPVVAYWLSVPVGPRNATARRRRTRAFRRRRAQDVALFRDVRHAADAWLPPDNYQENGGGRVARGAPRRRISG